MPATNLPTPLSIPPSSYWNGDDGSWSTFEISVGTPGQSVLLLPGTSASAGTTIWVVIPQGCSLANPGLPDCANSRGYLFRSNESSTWSTRRLGTGTGGALYNLNTFEEGYLGLTANAYYGFDTISLGLIGSGLPVLQNQVIAGFAQNTFWLGSLGLSPIPFNFTTLDDPLPSMMGTLRNQSLIPSSSWAYTAGAFYKDPPVPGSLTLGGFDTTRFLHNNVSFTFGQDFSRDLLVRLDSITYDTIGSSPLLASSIDIFIDSLVTQIWLPIEVCEAFEQQFNLTWNSSAELYLIDDDVHSSLMAQNPVFNFSIGQPGIGGGDTVDIILPYAAFDLNVTQPLVNSTSRYFPLKRAQNSTQYTLGRVFLQEAHIIADYDRRNFSVSQALFPPTSEAESIVPILPPESKNNSENTRSLGKDSIIGIAISIAIIITLVAGIVIWILRRHKRPPPTQDVNTMDEKRAHVEESMSNPVHEVHGGSKANELDCGTFTSPELPAKENEIGPVELGQDDAVHEIGLRNSVVELDASWN